MPLSPSCSSAAAGARASAQHARIAERDLAQQLERLVDVAVVGDLHLDGDANLGATCTSG